MTADRESGLTFRHIESMPFGSGHTGVVPFSASMYVVGPLIAFGVIAALCAVLRWAFDPEITYPAATTGDEDYGLLSVAGVTESAAEAWTVQHMLTGAGIRATTAALPDGRVRILVFTSELEQARRVVDGSAR